MKTLFIYSGAENLGLEHISSVLKSRGHETHLLFDPAVFSGDTLINNDWLARLSNIDDKIVKKAIDMKPDLVGFSAYTGNYRWCLEIARRIKAQADIPVVFGGVHATAVPEVVLENTCVDYVISGEGEYATADLLEHLEAGRGQGLLEIPNLCYKRDGQVHCNPPRPYIQELDDLPFADKLLFYEKVPLLEEQFLAITSRGCPYRCTYCSNDMLQAVYDHEKKHIRRRSPDNIIEELSYFKKRGRMKSIYFADDVFTLSQVWLEEFIEKYRARIALPFTCSVHPLSISPEKAALLKEGGCWLVTMGIQSASERVRKEVFMRRGNNEVILDAIAGIKKAGLKLTVDNIFGAPTETEDELRNSVAFYRQARPNRILTFWLTYYPKTSIIALAQKHGDLSQQDVEEIEKGNVGFAHGTGSVSPQKQRLYLRYEVLLHLSALVHSDRLYGLAARLADLSPFKKFTTQVIFLLNVLKNRDKRVLNGLRYIVTRKHTP